MGFLPEDLVNNFHFLRPMWLLALIPALLLFILLKFLQNQQTSWQRAIEPGLLPYLLDKTQTSRQNHPLYGLLMIWLVSAIAMAGPVWQQVPMPVQEREDALVVVMDLSTSMLSNDVTPNRITRATRKLTDILNTRRDEGLTALVVYAGDAHAVTPLTDDVETIHNLVAALDPGIMPVLGSRPLAGITLAQELLLNAAVEQARILLITDGISRNDISSIENLLAESTHTLSVLGIGTADGAPIPLANGGFLRDSQNAIVIPKLERDLLIELAAITSGRYADARLDDEDIDYLLDENILDQNENLAVSDREFDTWNEVGPWLLLLVLPLAAFAFRRGWMLSLCLLTLVFPHQRAYAFEWQDLWLKKDQQASQEFTKRDFEQAASLFEDPGWRGVANYRDGNFEEAVEDLALLNDAESHYNRGNALAQLNRLQEALAAYDAALAQQPGHADAQHNREIVENLLEQQEEN
ncbi:MAG: VWA domain-containing protein, partial [Pseudohongiellaceae bacterium]